ncbi:hypothetical protein [Streptomyces tubercidicus]|uniref:hypothetical protein n=1 Tax=Streptomyces tubercidicus TaxID=47759 RepID=UPI003466FDD2
MRTGSGRPRPRPAPLRRGAGRGVRHDGYHRDHALCLTRTAEAHLTQGAVENACASAGQAVTLLGGVPARPSVIRADNVNFRYSS